MTTIVASTIRITSYNNANGEMPYQLVCPQNDKITWTCGVDQTEKITEIYSYRGSDTEPPGKKGQYLMSKEEAISHRNQLLVNGWVPSKMPKARAMYPGMKPIEVGEEDSIKLNRRQKRNGAKMLDMLTNEKGHDRKTGKKRGKGVKLIDSPTKSL